MVYPFSRSFDNPVLPPVLTGNPQSISPAEWEGIRQLILQKLLSVFGNFPEAVQVKPVFKAERLLPQGVVCRTIQYDSNDGDRIEAYLMHSAELDLSAQHPAMMALHPTTVPGKEELAGLLQGGNSEYGYGWELAARGYIVLAPDLLTAGQRVIPGSKPYVSTAFDEKYPEWSMLGKMIYDHRLGVDILAGLPYVDSERIGAIGHSLGSYNTFLLGAFDERIKAAACSCGFLPFAGDTRPGRWGRRPGGCTHMGRVDEYLARGEAPFEFNEAAAAMAPRAFLNWSTQSDLDYENWISVGRAMLTIKQVYDALGRPERFHSLIGNGPHYFPAEIREHVYNWLDRQLKQG